MKGKIFKKVIASVSAVSMLASMAFVIPAQAETVSGQSVDLSKFSDMLNASSTATSATINHTGKSNWTKLDLTQYTTKEHKLTKKVTIAYKDTVSDGGRSNIGFYDNDVADWGTKAQEQTTGSAVVYGVLGSNTNKRVYVSGVGASGNGKFEVNKEQNVNLVIDFVAMTISGNVGAHTIESTNITNGIDSIDTMGIYSWSAMNYSLSDMTITTEYSDENYYTVTYADNVNNTASREKVQEGTAPTNVTEPVDATGKYIFKGWTTDTSEGSWLYNESKSSTYLTTQQLKETSITADTTYVAVFQQDASYIEKIAKVEFNTFPAGNTLTDGSNPITVKVTGENGTDILANPDSSIAAPVVNYTLKGFKWVAAKNEASTDPEDGDTYCDSYGKLTVTNNQADFKIDEGHNMNYYGSVEVTVTYNGTTTTPISAPLAYIGQATAVPNQILPRPGYLSNFNNYSPDMVGYKAAISGNNSSASDVVTDNWACYGSSAERTLEIAQDTDGSKFLKFTTNGKKGDGGRGSSMAANQITPVTDAQVVFSQMVRFHSDGSIMLKTENPVTWNDNDQSFGLGKAGQTLSLNGSEIYTEAANDVWYKIIITSDVKSKKCYAEVYSADGDKLGSSEVVDFIEDSLNPKYYIFAIPDNTAASIDFNDVVIKIAEIGNGEITADPNSAIPIPEDSTDTSVNLTLNAKTTDDLPAIGAVTWSEETDDPNVEVTADENDSQKAVLTVKQGADSGDHVIIATIGGKQFRYTAQLTSSQQNVQFDKTNGKSPASISIPLDGDDGDEYTYEAYVDNGKGTHVDNKTITYALLNSASAPYAPTKDNDGLTFDANTGKFTVYKNAKAQVVYVVASSKNDENQDISKSLRVDIHGLAFDFGAGTPDDLAEGYTAVTPSSAYSATAGYGISSGTTQAGGTPVTDALHDGDYLEGSSFKFEVKVPKNKLYRVKGKYQGNLAAEYVNSDLSGVSFGNNTVPTEFDVVVPVFDDTLDLTVSTYTDDNGTKDNTEDDKHYIGQLSYLVIEPLDDKTPKPKPHIYSVGDSTIANNGSWAYVLENRVKGSDEPYTNLAALADFTNNGRGGKNLCDYYTGGELWDRVLRQIQPGDFVTIGDMGTNGTGNTFKADLNHYIDSCIALGAKVILNTYSPHMATGSYAGCYNSSTYTFSGARTNDGYDKILLEVYNERNAKTGTVEQNPNIIGLIYIGEEADKSFSQYVQAGADDAEKAARADAIIKCAGSAGKAPDHNHYSNGTIACDLMLEGYGTGKGIVEQLTAIVAEDLANRPVVHTVTFQASNATVAVNGKTVKSTTVEEGEDLIFKVTPNDGYEIVSVTADNATVTPGTDGEYTLSDVTDNTTVTITTKAPTSYTVTFAIDGAATISVGGTPITGTTVDVIEGNDLSFTVTPGAGHNLVSVKAGDLELPEVGGVYTLNEIREDVTITITTEVDLNVWIEYHATYDATGKLTSVTVTPNATPQAVTNTDTDKTFYWNAQMKPWSAE